MKKITLLMPYYKNPGMLHRHFDEFEKYEKNGVDLSKVKVIIVDDGSPVGFEAESVFVERKKETLKNLDMLLARIKQNIPWNYPGARNLGFYLASTKWVFSTDIDHVLTAPRMAVLLEKDLNKNFYYRVRRYNRKADFSVDEIKYHSETYIMPRQMFDKTGGYNEDLSGEYFRAPTEFRKELKRIGAEEAFLNDIWVDHYNAFTIPDCNTTDWKREAVPMEKRRIEPNKNSERKTLRFEWEAFQW